MIRKLATCLATGVAAFGLAACVSVLPEPKVPQGLYRFAAVETVYDLEASIVVREPEASRLVAGRAIAAEDSSGALRFRFFRLGFSGDGLNRGVGHQKGSFGT